MSAAEPFFCVALRRDDGKWIIEAKWPDDSIEIVETFDDYFEALRWLSTEFVGMGRETNNSEEGRIAKRTPTEPPPFAFAQAQHKAPAVRLIPAHARLFAHNVGWCNDAADAS